MDDLTSVTRERDLFRHFLELGMHDDPRVFLDKALSLFIEVAGACRGYLELSDPLQVSDEPTFSLVKGMDDAELTPGGFSRTVIAETRSTGETVSSASALTDPRFRDRRSVQAQKLEAVLSVPIGTAPVLGVIYLQDRRAPGNFTSDDARRAEVCARHVARFADRLLWRHRHSADHPRSRGALGALKADPLVGSSEALVAVLKHVALAAPLNIAVLVTGDAGTGKKLLARLLHDNSARSAGPFVEVACSTLSDEAVDAALFGVKKTDLARESAPSGSVEAAEGGTLLLENVEELPMRAQGKLLQLLQTGTYLPKDEAAPRRSNVRVVATTTADLARAVTEKRFREDLFYRLNVYPIRMPTLGERRQDIAALAAHFVRLTCDANDIPLLELSAGAILALEHAEWARNVHELGHAVTRAALRAHAENGLRIERRHLFPSPAPSSALPRQLTFHEATRDFQARFLRDVLAREDWNVTAVARALDITRGHVYNLMATFQIRRP